MSKTDKTSANVAAKTTKKHKRQIAQDLLLAGVAGSLFLGSGLTGAMAAGDDPAVGVGDDIAVTQPAASNQLGTAPNTPGDTVRDVIPDISMNSFVTYLTNNGINPFNIYDNGDKYWNTLAIKQFMSNDNTYPYSLLKPVLDYNATTGTYNLQGPDSKTLYLISNYGGYGFSDNTFHRVFIAPSPERAVEPEEPDTQGDGASTVDDEITSHGRFSLVDKSVFNSLTGLLDSADLVCSSENLNSDAVKQRILKASGLINKAGYGEWFGLDISTVDGLDHSTDFGSEVTGIKIKLWVDSRVTLQSVDETTIDEEHTSTGAGDNHYFIYDLDTLPCYNSKEVPYPGSDLTYNTSVLNISTDDSVDGSHKTTATYNLQKLAEANSEVINPTTVNDVYTLNGSTLNLNSGYVFKDNGTVNSYELKNPMDILDEHSYPYITERLHFFGSTIDDTIAHYREVYNNTPVVVGSSYRTDLKLILKPGYYWKHNNNYYSNGDQPVIQFKFVSKDLVMVPDPLNPSNLANFIVKDETPISSDETSDTYRVISWNSDFSHGEVDDFSISSNYYWKLTGNNKLVATLRNMDSTWIYPGDFFTRYGNNARFADSSMKSIEFTLPETVSIPKPVLPYCDDLISLAPGVAPEVINTGELEVRGPKIDVDSEPPRDSEPIFKEPHFACNPNKPVEPEKPAEPEKPVESEKGEPTEPKTPVSNDSPSRPNTPTKPVSPVESTKPTEPKKPSESVEPKEPTKPTEPDQVIEVKTPEEPAESTPAAKVPVADVPEKPAKLSPELARTGVNDVKTLVGLSIAFGLGGVFAMLTLAKRVANRRVPKHRA